MVQNWLTSSSSVVLSLFESVESVELALVFVLMLVVVVLDSLELVLFSVVFVEEGVLAGSITAKIGRRKRENNFDGRNVFPSSLEEEGGGGEERERETCSMTRRQERKQEERTERKGERKAASAT